ncbi:MobF family relaxase [Streptantibioticus rubrisoli]|uniref:AAA family ATPase n=1 Tax=Streptantibioticus rubrisoli TaxID=1387313 RepID=A0ABT1PNI1_9ACTN|nr:MobF family relaxase [Streptantibioticus rubrisoli]MCQ4045808.1 AAA family ATPase [Streptantibioticus rubrisoli]
MLSISTGSDPGYLTKEVGQGREHYYLRSIDEAGEPPGYWTGDGAAELGLSGEVSNDVMTDLYTDFIDPRKRDEMYAKLAEITADPESEEYKQAEAKIRKEARLGTAPKTYEKAFEKRFAAAVEKAQERAAGDLTPEQIKSIELSVRKEAPSATLYYDLTFSAPKSWSVYHASLQVKAAQAREAGDVEAAEKFAKQAEQVWDCWKTGVQAGIEHMQEEAGYSRAGHHGAKVGGRTSGRFVEAPEFTAAAFAQHTSRNDDPQLHVHVAVLNKVKTVDIDPVTGQERVVWRALDGQGLFRHKQAAGHLAERVAEQELERTLGVRVQMRPDGKAREIVGISPELRDEFSSRRTAIKETVAELAKAYEERHGVAPTPYVLARMSEDVTLDQRQAKKHDALSRERLLDRWEASSKSRLRESLADVPEQVALESALHERYRPAGEFDPARIQRRAIAAVQEQKATWTRPDLIVELNRQLPDTLGGLDRHQVRDLLNTLADEALNPTTDNGVVRTTAPHIVEIPAELQRKDGSFIYEPAQNTTNRYATEDHLRVEERLREFAGLSGAPAVPRQLVEDVIERRGLTGKQAEFVRQAATSGRQVDLLIGPAGAGKSYTLAALCEVWEQHNNGQVLGLASGQRAADVLAEEGISNVANISKLLKANAAMAAGREVDDAELYRIRPGQLVIVDEAGMTNTPDMKRVADLVEASGAKMIMSGDHGQLSAVGAGGMFAQLAEDLPGVHTLEEVRRFRDTDAWGNKTVRQWEADASLQLRQGDSEALAAYQAHGRLRGGSAEAMTERAYQGWIADHLAGRNPLLIASTNEQAADLSMRARADLVRAGLVEEDGVVLRTGDRYQVETRAGRGDLIQLRKNDRNITGENDRFAVNRLTAKVTGIGDDGSLMVQLEDGGRMYLPAAYVKTNVELAYCSTVHGAQGRTVGVCHSLVDEQTTRESLYVALTRGEGGNYAYVITHGKPGDGIKPEEAPHHLASLDQALQRTELEQTATQSVRDELERREHLAVMEPVWSGVKDQQAEARFGSTLLDALGPEEYERLSSEEAYASLMRLARHVEEQGHDAEDLLRRTATSRELDSADSHSSVLYWRLERAYNLAERDIVLAEESEQRAAVAEQTERVETVLTAAYTAPLQPDQPEAAQHAMAMQLVDLGQAMTTEDQDQEVAEAVAEAHTAPPVHPHQEEALQQAMAMQYLPVAHAGQDVEVRQRQADEREARMEALDSYTARTPEIDGDLGRFMGEWAHEMDQRVERLGQRVAEQQPEWAMDRLGPVPEDPTQRAEWERCAGRIERYREAHGYDNEHDAIGQAPPQGAVEARADWERARRALGVPEQQADITRASDESLRQSIERYEREEEWAPQYVADDLEKASLAHRDYGDQAVQLELRAKEMAEQEAAEHEERVTDAVYNAQTAHGYTYEQEHLNQVMAMQQAHTLQAEIDPSERQKEIEGRAETSRDIAETMRERAEQLHEIHETREQWYAETQQAREESEYARIELERRTPEPQIEEPDAPDSTATTPAAQDPYELEQAMEQARRAQEILAERAREREQAAQREPEHAEDADRERRDTAYEAEYARIGHDLAAAEHDVEPAASSPAPPAPEPEPVPEPAPEPEIEM